MYHILTILEQNNNYLTIAINSTIVEFMLERTLENNPCVILWSQKLTAIEFEHLQKIK